MYAPLVVPSKADGAVLQSFEDITEKNASQAVFKVFPTDGTVPRARARAPALPPNPS